MADSDEDDFEALGTAFEELEEDAPRKKPVPIHEQIVTDSKGRRRFHGAFTGGFSAGYFNSVDTKEGWTPKTFISSRSQKSSESATQRPEDFMDEEDFGEFGIAPKRVVTTEKFLPNEKEGKERKRILGPARPTDSERSIAGVIQGSEALQDLIIPVKMSIGVRLLSQMGWKEGQGIGPRVRRSAKKTYGGTPQQSASNDDDDGDDIYAAGLLFAPKDVESTEYKSKDNLHGIGYSGINPKTALYSQRDWLGLDPAGPSAVGIKGQGFGVGALEEEDDDIYQQDNLSNYDIDMTISTSRKKKTNDLHGWTGPPQTSQQGGLLSTFTKISKPPARKIYPPPIVPRDFRPGHKTTGPTQQSTSYLQHKSKTVKLTAKERGEALGEAPLPKPKKSVFDYVSEEDKARLKEPKDTGRSRQSSRWSEDNDNKSSIKDNESASTTSDGHSSGVAGFSRMVYQSSGFKPFVKDPEKQARYELFLKGKTADVDPFDSKMTEWERECEAEEFTRAATLYRPLSQTMAARFTSAKDTDDQPSREQAPSVKTATATPTARVFGAMTRERFEWHPNRILCKRFNIPDPYPGSAITGVPPNQKRTSFHEKLYDIKAIEYQSSGETQHGQSDENDHKASTFSEQGLNVDVQSSNIQDETNDSNLLASSFQEEEKSSAKTKTSALLAGFQAMASKTPTAPQESAMTDVYKNTEEKQLDENIDVLKLAPMDLFKTVFAESSSESDSEESEEEAEIKEDERKDSKIASIFEKQANTADSQNDKLDFEDQSNSKEQLFDNKLNESEILRRDNLAESTNQAAIDAFGPALPSTTTRLHSTTNFAELESSGHKRDKKTKHKSKKKKKGKSKKYKDSDDDSEYDKRKKDKKRNKESYSSSSDDSYRESRVKGRKKERAKYSYSDESSDSDEDDSRKYEKTKKKTAKHKDKKKHKTKRDKSEKRRSKSDFNEEDYEERTIENITNLKGERQRKEPSEKSEEFSKSNRNKRDENDDDNRSMNKDIMSKLKNIQLLKEGKRMRAADYM